MRISVFSLLGLMLTRLHSINALCPNACSMQGSCNHFNRCDCYSGFTGGDCSERLCAHGKAWSDEATGTDVAHNQAMCSNRGTCDRKLGKCVCMPGFSGAACDRIACPNDNRCSGHGTCFSMQEYAENYRGLDSITHTYTSGWDSSGLYGCVCDTGYLGFDCSLRECPRGDDPLTINQKYEVQIILCQAIGGSFTLTFDDQVSPNIAFNANAAAVETAIEAIPIVGDVDVSFSRTDLLACDINVRQLITVTFKQNFGPLRPMWANTIALSLGGGTDPGVQITAGGSQILDTNGVPYLSVVGTRENTECSSRGLCDSKLGVCTCYTTNDDIFASSDGNGGPGTRGDCGYAVTPTAGCPGELSCSGHGSCDTTTFSCTCNEGWGSGDCSQRECPYGNSWFSYPDSDESAHKDLLECSGGGVCSRDTGVCKCGVHFRGAACEYLKCPGTLQYGDSGACTGHGVCMSMAALAAEATVNGDAGGFTYGTDPNNGATWDANSVYGCKCDSGYGGYDCSERVCPSGDDPGTFGQSLEVQLLQCTASAGSLALTFRQATTTAIPFDADFTAVTTALENLWTVGLVTVAYSTGAVLCTPTGTNIASITFTTDYADLPSLTVDKSLLVDALNGGAPGSGTVNIATDGNVLGGVNSVLGTTENDICSNRGMCDRSTGQCMCFKGWFSGDGLGGVGDRGDCSYRVPAGKAPNANGDPSLEDEAKYRDAAMDFAKGNPWKDMAMIAIANVAQH